MTDKEVKLLFKKYIQNQCTVEEYQLVLQFLKSTTYDHLLKEVIQNENYFEADEQVKYLMDEKLFNRVEERLLDKILKEKAIKSQRKKVWLQAAAILVAIASVAYTIFFWENYSTSTQQYTTGYRETKTIQLADGSVVTMNANTKLVAFSQVDKQKAREVWVDGEAFFKISKMEGGESKQFIVHASELNIQVLGTEFNVNSRRGKIKVVLNEGKVKLETEGQKTDEKGLFMKPGDMVEYHQTARKFVQKTVIPERYSAWKQNQLVFNDTPLSEIAQLIEDNYGYKVKYDTAVLKNRKLTAKYPADNIDILIKAMTKLFNLKITKTNEEITIESNPEN